jgi:TrmH family RNA methyltransferase
MGAVFHVPLLKVQQDWLANRPEKIIVSVVHGGVSLNDYNFPIAPFILVIGSEAQGVSDFINKLASEKIHIPLSENMESLNVAVAVGILLYRMENIC